MHCTFLTTEQEKRIEITAALNYCVTGLHHATHCEETAETLPCKKPLTAWCKRMQSINKALHFQTVAALKKMVATTLQKHFP